MELTKILDVVTPEVFNEYMQQYATEHSAFIQSGIAVADERVSKNITAGGLQVHMPFWNDLTGDSEVLGDGDKALETGKIVAGADNACVLYRGRGWGANELAGVVVGSDPVQAILSRIGAYWLRQEQKVLLSVLGGLFNKAEDTTKGTLYDTHVLDASTKVLDAGMVLDAKQLLGDYAGQIVAIAMHSAVYTKLQKDNLIQYIQPTEANTGFATYLGYRVIVDDGIKPDAKGVYKTYLFRQGAIGRNTGTPSGLTTFEVARDHAKGNDMIYTRQALVLHPYGVKWTNAQVTQGNITPSNSDLENIKNWQRVYEPKNVGIIAINHKIA